MLKFWITGDDSACFVITSAATRVEMSGGAAVVTDRDGLPHRIETERAPTPIRFAMEFPENLLALENNSGIRFDTLLIDTFKTRQSIIFMESTREKAYQAVVESLDERMNAGLDRLQIEPYLVRAVFLMELYGSYTDWHSISSIVWDE